MERDEAKAGWENEVDSDDSTGGSADAEITAALEGHAAAARVHDRIEPYLEIGKQLHVSQPFLPHTWLALMLSPPCHAEPAPHSL